VGLGAGLQKVLLLPSPMPGTSDPVCLGSPLQPIIPPSMYVCLPMFIFPLIPFFEGEWQWVIVTAVYGWWLWMHSGPFFWIALTVAGITVVPRECSRMGWCPCAWVPLFVFPPPFVGGGVRACLAQWEAHVCPHPAVSALQPLVCEVPSSPFIFYFLFFTS
jgi:hypothetical protein